MKGEQGDGLETHNSGVLTLKCPQTHTCARAHTHTHTPHHHHPQTQFPKAWLGNSYKRALLGVSGDKSH